MTVNKSKQAKKLKPQDRIIVALDTHNFATCRKWVRSLKGSVNFFKVGNELFTSVGIKAVKYIQDQGGEVFLDLKFHDIPNTVAQSASVVAQMGVKLFNVHTLGGLAMMRAAREAVDAVSSKTSIIGVTILTSMKQTELTKELLIKTPLAREVLHLARLVRKAGLDGVVASAQEVSMIKKAMGNPFLVVTPGIRPAWAARGDQSRVVTPRQALELGSDYMVIGRPITGMPDPKGAAERIIEEMKA